MSDLAKLREPFPAGLVGKLPKAGITLDYVGHGAVTDRLLQVDENWSWEPFALDDGGLPRFTMDSDGNPIAFWIRLTVLGVSRPGVGTCPSNQRDAEKVLIGDALRNAAMRFGVALDLWIKGHAEDDEKQANGASGAPRRKAEENPYVSAENAQALRDKCELLGLEVSEVVKLGTEGRTSDPAQVRKDEIRGVKEALDSLSPAGEDQGVSGTNGRAPGVAASPVGGDQMHLVGEAP